MLLLLVDPIMTMKPKNQTIAFEKKKRWQITNQIFGELSSKKKNIPENKRNPSMILKNLKLLSSFCSPLVDFIFKNIKIHKTMLIKNIKPVGTIAKAKFSLNNQHLGQTKSQIDISIDLKHSKKRKKKNRSLPVLCWYVFYDTIWRYNRDHHNNSRNNFEFRTNKILILISIRYN